MADQDQERMVYTGRASWPRTSRHMGLERADCKEGISVLTGKTLGRKTDDDDDPDINNTWARLDDPDWRSQFCHYIIDEFVQHPDMMTVDSEEREWIFNWVRKLLYEPKFDDLRSRADTHARGTAEWHDITRDDEVATT